MDRRDLLALLGGAGLASLACRPDRGQRDPLVELSRQGHPYQFTALNPHQAATVAVLADCIIPATDTPGAAEAGVPAFVDVIVGEWYEPAERTAFLEGLAALDAQSTAEEGVPLVKLAAERRTAFLTAVDRAAVAERKANPDGPTPFWVRLKGLTLYGYYTSAVGVTEELGRPAIPGRYAGCEPLPAARPGAL